MDWLTGPRLLIREVTGKSPYKIQATYIEDTYCNYKTILNVNPKNGSGISMKYLCGVLNSKLISFIYSYSSNKIEADSFPRLSVGDLKQIPIKNVSVNESSEAKTAEKIEFLVDEITSIKLINPLQDSTNIDTEIDLLVYELYGLTEEEIRIVEGECIGNISLRLE